MRVTQSKLYLLLFVCSMCISRGPLYGQDVPYLLFKNSLGEKIEMWLYAQDPAGWTKPAQILDISETRNVKFPTKSRHFVVLVDSKFRQDKLGWFDFYSQAQKEPGKEVRLTALYKTYTVMQTEQRTQMKTVTKMRAETRTRIVKQKNPISGVVEDKEQTYTVQVPVTEQIAQVYSVEVPVNQTRAVRKLELGGPAGVKELVPTTASDLPEPKLPWEEKSDDKVDSPPTNRPRLGISFHICPSGVHVLSVEPGSPATKCLNTKTNQVVSLEVDDHIVSINGKQPTSDEETVRLIAEAGKELNLEVLDKRTNATILLRATVE